MTDTLLPITSLLHMAVSMPRSPIPDEILATNFVCPDMAHRKGWDRRTYGRILATSTPFQQGSISSTTQAIRDPQDPTLPSKSTSYRHITSLWTEAQIEHVGRTGNLEIILEYARLTNQWEVFLMTDEFFETTRSRTKATPGKPVTPSGARAGLTKIGQIVAKMGSKSPDDRDFLLRSLGRGHETLKTLCAFADDVCFTVENYLRQPIRDRNVPIAEREAEVARGLQTLGFTVTNRLKDSRWAGGDTLQADIESGIPFTTKLVKKELEVTFSKQRKMLGPPRPLKAFELFPTAVPLPGRKNWFVATARMRPYADHPVEVTVVFTFFPKNKSKIGPNDKLVLGKNMDVSYLATSLPATIENALYCAKIYPERWLIEIGVKTHKQYRRKGSGSRMVMRAILLQLASLQQNMATFVAHIRARRSGRKAQHVRYTFLRRAMVLTAALVLASRSDLRQSLEDLLSTRDFERLRDSF